MKASESAGGLDNWRVYFANTDIFDVIKQGITIAASNFPEEFKLRRDKIAQILYSSSRVVNTCSGCVDHSALLASNGGDEPSEVETLYSNAGTDSHREGPVETSHKAESPVSNTSGNVREEEEEVLTDEESWVYGEVLRIKKIVDDAASGLVSSSGEEKEYSKLVGSLIRLESMGLQYKILKETRIGVSVTALWKNQAVNEDVRNLSKKLVRVWKDTVDDEYWAATVPAEAVADPKSETRNPEKLSVEVENVHTPEKKLISFTQERLEAAKRKMKEGYKKIEKRHRRVQVMLLDDVPNQSCEQVKKPAGDSHNTRRVYGKRH